MDIQGKKDVKIAAALEVSLPSPWWPPSAVVSSPACYSSLILQPFLRGFLTPARLIFVEIKSNSSYCLSMSSTPSLASSLAPFPSYIHDFFISSATALSQALISQLHFSLYP